MSALEENRPHYEGPERRKISRVSIKTKLTKLFLLMGFFPALLILSIMYIGVSNNFESQTGIHLKNLALETSLRVDMFLQNKIQNVHKYASYSTLKRDYFPGSRAEMTSEFIRSLFKFDPDLYNISLINKQKKVLFSYRPSLNALEKVDSWWAEATQLVPGQILILPSKDNDQIPKNLEILVPLQSDINSKRLGYMIAAFKFNSLEQLIRSIPTSGKYYLSLINQHAVLLATTLKTDTKPLSSAAIKNLFLQDEGWTQAFDPNQGAVSVFGFYPIKTFNRSSVISNKWKIYVSWDKEEAFRPILWLMIKLIGLCLGIVISLLILFLFRIEKIWKPIFTLKKGAEAIGAGKLDQNIEIRTSDELEDLANSFNKMRINLAGSRHTLEEKNRKLKQLNEVKNNFISMISHELRTPLMIIKEAVNQILEGLKGPVSEEQKPFLQMASRNTNRLSKIIEDLLNISKIETGKIKFCRQKSDLISILDNEILNQEMKSEKGNITVNRHYPRSQIFAYCDPEKVQIIFANLLGNALKFTPENGQIDVCVVIEDDRLLIKVKDSGHGFPSEQASKIFDRFFKLNQTPLVGAPSSGLGLAIAKELVEMHSGKIWAESDGENGSTFYFSLPIFSGLEYLDIYFDDRILESRDRELELTIIKFKLSSFLSREKAPKEKTKKIFNKFKNALKDNPFEILEGIFLSHSNEIYLFTFLDEESSGVIAKNLNDILFSILEQDEIQYYYFVFFTISHLQKHGKDREELLRYHEKMEVYFEEWYKSPKPLEKCLPQISHPIDFIPPTLNTSSKPLNDYLESNLLDLDQIQTILTKFTTLKSFNAKRDYIDVSKCQRIGEKFLKTNQCLFMQSSEDKVSVAMVDPFDSLALTHIESLGDLDIHRHYICHREWQVYLEQIDFRTLENPEKSD